MNTDSDKLIITATVGMDSWISPGLIKVPKTAEEIAEEVFKCYKCGATIAHIHGAKNWTKDFWAKTVETIRKRCDIIIQMGLSALPIQEREEFFELKPDMLSIVLNHHDEAFTNVEMNLLHTREELEKYAKLCRNWGIKPEFEVWHSGSIWNLNYLVQRSLVDKPYFLTLFFGWPGGTWAPPTFDELLHRIKILPSDAVYSVSTMHENQMKLAALTIMLGGHVRVGIEDNPYLRQMDVARDNSELVARIADVCRCLDRPLASTSDARTVVGI